MPREGIGGSSNGSGVWHTFVVTSFPFSSRTVGLLVEAVSAHTATHMETLFLKAEVDRWRADAAPNKEARAQILLRNLRSDGTKDAYNGVLELTRPLLKVGKASSDWNQPSDWWPSLRDAAAADGWEYDETRDVLVPTVPGAQVADEVTWLEEELRRRGWTTTAGHYQQAVESFAAGNWAAANGQLRSFFEDLIRTAGGRSSGRSGQVQASVDQLDRYGHLITDEGGFVKQLWKMLHSNGSHPGLSDEDESRFRLLILTGYARFLLSRLPG